MVRSNDKWYKTVLTLYDNRDEDDGDDSVKTMYNSIAFHEWNPNNSYTKKKSKNTFSYTEINETEIN